MRFLADGPVIPDELLNSRDEGSVIFFCGAGVSRARAGLPDFWGLAEGVVKGLGASSSDDVHRMLRLAREMESSDETSGLISADRIFGLLEREFSDQDIEEAVSNTLKPACDVDLSAHQIMLDLSRAPDGTVRLVTTNFDLLFEKASDKCIKRWEHPNLPDLRYVDLEGIIHLHGCVNENYSSATSGGFVLSSSNFGRAYLSEGWATQFIREVLSKYLFVFVGYTADDPPVHYLLEALNRKPGVRNDLYAFQSGSNDDAEARWRHKGVRPIAYNSADNHRALWETLSAWAMRARDPESWMDSVFSLAKKDPATLVPHERGQVAHVVSTVGGMRRFSTSEEPPPADWLCVFDRYERYATPSHIGRFNEERTYFDPFNAFCLDSDPIPPKIDQNNYLALRKAPANAWDCFSSARIDHLNLRDEHFAAFRGHPGNTARLPVRLALLGTWIARVADQPTALWWASSQVTLHPDIRDRIRYAISHNDKCDAKLRHVWWYVLNATMDRDPINRKLHEIEAFIRYEGWTNSIVKELAESVRPYLRINRSRHSRPRNGELTIDDLVSLEIKFPDPPNTIPIPDDLLALATREFRRNLEEAISLKREIGGYGLYSIPPIEPDPNLVGTGHRRNKGIASSLFFYVELFKQLITKNLKAAVEEQLAWPSENNEVFDRLRIWICLERRIVADVQVSQLFYEMTEDVFWDSRHQRDLLLVLKERWNDLTGEALTEIERKLLRGPQHVISGSAAYRSSSSLNRIYWLKEQGCKFGFDFDAVTLQLHLFAPEWKTEYARDAAKSLEATADWVRTDTDYTKLLTEPLATTLTKAKELSGRTTTHFVENDPFAGLAMERPIRALSALSLAAKRNDYPEWAWRTFLTVDARKSDRPKFFAQTAERLARLPQDTLSALIDSASEWLLQAAQTLLQSFPVQFQRIWTQLISALKANPDSGKSSIVRRKKDPDWATEALNAPVGKLSQALMKDPQVTELSKGNALPIIWINRADELLSLEGELSLHALVIFGHNLQWFFYIDPVWTEKTLLSLLDKEGNEQSAIWAGFYWGISQVPDKQLYVRIKPHLLKQNLGNRLPHGNELEILAALLLTGWMMIDETTNVRFVTSEEMREALLNGGEDFRLHMLSNLKGLDKDAVDDSTHNVATFLREAWPKHKKVRSPKISTRLCDLAYSRKDWFAEIVDIILPLLTPIDSEQYLDLGFQEPETSIVNLYPERTLALLYAILPDAGTNWLYGMDSILDRIKIADPSLLRDRRLMDLRRRLDIR